MIKYEKSADTQILVSKVKEVGKRKELDKVRLLNLSVAIAQRDSNTAIEGISTILSDDTVTPLEKKQLELLKEQLNASYSSIITEAEKYEKLDTWTAEQATALSSYKASYNAFLSALNVILENMETSSTVDRATFLSIAQTYYDNQKNFDLILQMFRYGIDKIVFFYLATAEQSKPEAEDVNLEEIPELSAELKFLWRKEVIYYTNGVATIQVDLIGAYGDTGRSFTVVIESSNGNVFRPTNIKTTLSCRVYANDEEITESIPEYNYNWKRTTGYPIEDAKWNTTSKAIGHRSIDITTDDCLGRTVFNCEVELGE